MDRLLTFFGVERDRDEVEAERGIHVATSTKSTATCATEQAMMERPR
jgi:hypothetical protein